MSRGNHTRVELPAEPCGGDVAAGFYESPGGDDLMRLAHFPDEVLSFLQMEHLTMYRAITHYGCDVIVELGCYDGRAFEVSRAAGTRYVGVDVNGVAIGRLRERIAEEGAGEWASGIIGDALRPDRWMAAIPAHRPLVVLPFNFLGSLHDPRVLLERLAACRGLAMVATFNASAASTELRRRYYLASGVGPLRESTGSYGGVAFAGDRDFYSDSFDGAGLLALLRDSRIRPLIHVSNRIGLCVVGQLAGTGSLS